MCPCLSISFPPSPKSHPSDSPASGRAAPWRPPLLRRSPTASHIPLRRSVPGRSGRHGHRHLVQNQTKNRGLSICMSILRSRCRQPTSSEPREGDDRSATARAPLDAAPGAPLAAAPDAAVRSGCRPQGAAISVAPYGRGWIRLATTGRRRNSARARCARSSCLGSCTSAALVALVDFHGCGHRRLQLEEPTVLVHAGRRCSRPWHRRSGPPCVAALVPHGRARPRAERPPVQEPGIERQGHNRHFRWLLIKNEYNTS